MQLKKGKKMETIGRYEYGIWKQLHQAAAAGGQLQNELDTNPVGENRPRWGRPDPASRT